MDAELEAMQAVFEALRHLDEPVRLRVTSWVAERLKTNPESIQLCKINKPPQKVVKSRAPNGQRQIILPVLAKFDQPFSATDAVVELAVQGHTACTPSLVASAFHEWVMRRPAVLTYVGLSEKLTAKGKRVRLHRLTRIGRAMAERASSSIARDKPETAALSGSGSADLFAKFNSAVGKTLVAAWLIAKNNPDGVFTTSELGEQLKVRGLVNAATRVSAWVNDYRKRTKPPWLEIANEDESVAGRKYRLTAHGLTLFQQTAGFSAEATPERPGNVIEIAR